MKEKGGITSLGLATEWIEIADTSAPTHCCPLVSVLRPSGLKYGVSLFGYPGTPVSVLRPSGLKFFFLVENMSWLFQVSVLRPSGLKYCFPFVSYIRQCLGLATEWIEILLSKQH